MAELLRELIESPSQSLVWVLAFLGTLSLLKWLLDFVKSTLLPRAHERRLRQRKLVLPLAEKVLDAPWEKPAFFRDGNPKLVDFREDFVFPRPEFSATRAMLSRGRFAHIQGPPSSGKTVIALNLAYEYSRDKRRALYFARPSTVSDAFFDYLATPEAERYLDRPGFALILDDVHLDAQEI